MEKDKVLYDFYNSLKNGGDVFSHQDLELAIQTLKVAKLDVEIREKRAHIDHRMPPFEIKEGVLIKYNGHEENVIVPDGVKIIGARAFRGCDKIKTVTLPSSVTEIEKHAFAYRRSLKSIYLPDSIKIIHEYAFYDCTRLEEIIIPPKVSYIAVGTFKGCSSLKSVTLTDNISCIGSSAFYGCKKMKNIDIPSGVVRIENNVFSECENLENINIPDGVQTIEDLAFYGCSRLKHIKLPASVVNVNYYKAFPGCHKITIEQEVDNGTAVLIYL